MVDKIIYYADMAATVIKRIEYRCFKCHEIYESKQEAISCEQLDTFLNPEGYLCVLTFCYCCKLLVKRFYYKHIEGEPGLLIIKYEPFKIGGGQ